VWRRDGSVGEESRALLRLLVAAAKYRTAEQAVRAASAAIEMLGGIGYTEEYATARLLRDAQVLTVWEGTANIQALELLRILAGPADGARILSNLLAPGLEQLPNPLQDLANPIRDAIAGIGAAAGRIRSQPQNGPAQARILLEKTADVLSAATLLGGSQNSPCRKRRAFGALWRGAISTGASPGVTLRTTPPSRSRSCSTKRSNLASCRAAHRALIRLLPITRNAATP
jgi:hypothetical protein